MSPQQIKIITLLTLILALALAVVSFFGAFAADTYTRDAASMAAQGQGQDLVDLFLVVPRSVSNTPVLYHRLCLLHMLFY